MSTYTVAVRELSPEDHRAAMAAEADPNVHMVDVEALPADLKSDACRP